VCRRQGTKIRIANAKVPIKAEKEEMEFIKQGFVMMMLGKKDQSRF